MADSLKDLLAQASTDWEKTRDALIAFDYVPAARMDDEATAPNPNDDTPMPITPDSFDEVYAAIDQGTITAAQVDELTDALAAKGGAPAAAAADAPVSA